MDIETAREFSVSLRRLARRADNACYDRQEILEAIIKIAEGYEEVADDNACYDRQEILEAIIKIAEGYEEVADDLEMKKIVQM